MSSSPSAVPSSSSALSEQVGQESRLENCRDLDHEGYQNEHDDVAKDFTGGAALRVDPGNIPNDNNITEEDEDAVAAAAAAVAADEIVDVVIPGQQQVDQDPKVQLAPSQCSSELLTRDNDHDDDALTAAALEVAKNHQQHAAESDDDDHHHHYHHPEEATEEDAAAAAEAIAASAGDGKREETEIAASCGDHAVAADIVTPHPVPAAKTSDDAAAAEGCLIPGENEKNSNAQPTTENITNQDDEYTGNEISITNVSSTEEQEQDPTAFVLEPAEMDILSGRGASVNACQGNKRFRALCFARKPEFEAGNHAAKRRVAAEIVQTCMKQWGCRFLKRKDAKGPWYYMTFEQSLLKACQVIRDHRRPDRLLTRGETGSKKGNRATATPALEDVPIPKPPSEPIVENPFGVHDHDVLCGRGGTFWCKNLDSCEFLCRSFTQYHFFFWQQLLSTDTLAINAYVNLPLSANMPLIREIFRKSEVWPQRLLRTFEVWTLPVAFYANGAARARMPEPVLVPQMVVNRQPMVNIVKEQVLSLLLLLLPLLLIWASHWNVNGKNCRTNVPFTRLVKSCATLIVRIERIEKNGVNCAK